MPNAMPHATPHDPSPIPSDPRLARTVTVVPIYRAELPADEAWAMERSLPLLAGRRVVFIGPQSLDARWYRSRYPQVELMRFDDSHFASVKGYNLLLLDPAFYQAFAAHAFMLVLQTDAVLLSDQLDHWAGQPYDYVGAPWPQGIEISVQLDRHQGGHHRKVFAKVGNGGFSLRRIQACLNLLAEFPDGLALFRRSGSSEDIFFSVLGSLSTRFVLPGEMVAAQFAWELLPESYHAMLGQLPMGVHAWRKHSPDFWRAQWPEAAHLFEAAGPAAAASAASPTAAVA
jgi:Protein of unknown function (DUF5672)